MRIAVDLDGVLADTIVSWCRIFNERRGTRLTVDSLVRWSAWEIAGITRDEFFGILDDAWSEWEVIPPTEENLPEKVAAVARFGQVDIVTGRSIATVRSAKQWLRHHNIAYNDFVTVEGVKAKVNLNYDVYVDDSPKLMPRIASRLHGWGVLYARPWNRHSPDMPRIFRVREWREIPAVLEEISREKA